MPGPFQKEFPPPAEEAGHGFRERPAAVPPEPFAGFPFLLVLEGSVDGNRHKNVRRPDGYRSQPGHRRRRPQSPEPECTGRRDRPRDVRRSRTHPPDNFFSMRHMAAGGGRSGSVCGNRRSRGRTRRIPPAGGAIPCCPDKLRDFIWQREAASVSGAPERHQKPWSKSLFGRGTVSGKNRPHPAAAPQGSLPHIAEKGRPSAWTAAPSRQSRGFRPLAVCAESCIMEETSTASRLGTGRSHPHEYRRVPDLQSAAGISGPG